MKNTNRDRRHDPTRSFGYSQQDHYGRHQRYPSGGREYSRYEGLEFNDTDHSGDIWNSNRPRRNGTAPGGGYRQERTAYESLNDEGYRDYRSEGRYGKEYGEAWGGDAYRADTYESVWHPDNESSSRIERPMRSQSHRAQGTLRSGDHGVNSTSRFEDEVPNYRGKGPASYKRSDERISEDLHECLTEHSRVDASEIDIEVVKGKVTLSGFVPDRWMKFAAEEMAERVKGVEDIENKIRVQKTRLNLRPSEKEDSNDRQITRH